MFVLHSAPQQGGEGIGVAHAVALAVNLSAETRNLTPMDLESVMKVFNTP